MNDIRYGVFLRPDPATCWTVTQIYQAVNQQFGRMSAIAFAPHATLAGNLATGCSVEGLIAVLDPVFCAVGPIPIYNSGLERNSKNAFEYNINLAADGLAANQPLAQVASQVKAAVMPLSVPVNDFLVTPVDEYPFAAHLSLTGHELVLDGRLSDEIGEFIAGLPLTPPASFTLRWYTLFEFRADWDGPWWEQMTWRHIKSWDVAKL
ncbi:hypothetical protein AB4Z38_22485 [Arthrobacter sp. 2RAF6]|uniref:hypothetical protein n=1 Tax=Arthrobacter sp. 2RAF6 TaxID=3233002 RepID=UPI003F9206BB